MGPRAFPAIIACSYHLITNPASFPTPYLMLPSKRQCVASDGTYDGPDNITKTCKRVSSAYISPILLNGFIPNITISCHVESMVYFVYELYWGVDNITLADMIAQVGANLTQNVLIPTTDANYWLGYGGIAYVNTSYSINITSPLKNSGEAYVIWMTCVSLVGGLSSTDKGSWHQPSNGATIAKLTLTSSVPVSSANKLILGTAVKKVLNRGFNPI